MKNTKKLLALLLAMIMCFSFSSFALAEESEEAAGEEIPEMHWEEVAEEVIENIPGEFYFFEEVSAVMYVPEVLLPVELTEEDIENGYIAYFETEDGTTAVAVMYVDVDGMTLDEYKELLLEEEGVEDVEEAYVNDILFVSYTMPESDAMSVCTDTEEGYILEITFAPMSDEDFVQVAGLMTMSIHAVDEENEEIA